MLTMFLVRFSNCPSRFFQPCSGRLRGGHIAATEGDVTRARLEDIIITSCLFGCVPRVAMVLVCGCACVGMSRVGAGWVPHHPHHDKKHTTQLYGEMSADMEEEPHLHRDGYGALQSAHALNATVRTMARDPEARGIERFDAGKRARVSALHTALPPELIQRIYYDYIPIYMSKMQRAHYQLLHEDQFLRLTDFQFDFCVDYEFAERIPELESVD